MAEPRPLASLTAGLLARKGQARPAVRTAFVPRTVEARAEPRRPEPQDDEPTVVVQQRRLAAVYNAPDPVPGEKRVAMTLRLDADRHYRLKLLAARRRTSARALIVDALDELFMQSANDGCVCGAQDTQ